MNLIDNNEPMILQNDDHINEFYHKMVIEMRKLNQVRRWADWYFRRV